MKTPLWKIPSIFDVISACVLDVLRNETNGLRNTAYNKLLGKLHEYNSLMVRLIQNEERIELLDNEILCSVCE